MQLNQVFKIESFPEFYQSYRWSNKHHLYGYPADFYPEFSWISSLEKRFAWLVKNAAVENTASRYLIREMIQWGGSQNGTLQKFDDGSGEINLHEHLLQIIAALDDPDEALLAALQIPGLGLTYASKLLRFMRPQNYAALDGQIRGELAKEKLLRVIYDGNETSMRRGYLEFLDIVSSIEVELSDSSIRKPVAKHNRGKSWRAADIEMAIFSWTQLRKKRSGKANDGAP